MPCPAIRSDRLPEMPPGRHVERRGGLVEEQQFRVAREGEREPHPLGLAAGQLLDPPVRQVVDPGQGEQFGGAPAVPVELPEQADQLGHPGGLGQAAGLQHAADLAGRHGRRGGPAQDPDLTGGRRAQPQHGVDRGGLARTVRAEQRHRLAGLDIEGHVVQRLDVGVVHLDDVAERDGRAGGTPVICGHALTLGAPAAAAL